MAKIVQILTRPSNVYKQEVADAQVRDLDGIIQKLKHNISTRIKR